jgi:hypothetical protein
MLYETITKNIKNDKVGVESKMPGLSIGLIVSLLHDLEDYSKTNVNKMKYFMTLNLIGHYLTNNTIRTIKSPHANGRFGTPYNSDVGEIKIILRDLIVIIKEKQVEDEGVDEGEDDEY